MGLKACNVMARGGIATTVTTIALAFFVETKMQKCKKCGELVIIATRDSGSPAPFNRSPDESGNVIITFNHHGEGAHRAAILSQRQADEVRTKPLTDLYKSHLTTCSGVMPPPRPKRQRKPVQLKKSPDRERVESIAASSVDLFFECSSSVLRADTPYSPQIEGSRFGTAVHEAIRHTIQGEDDRVEHVAAAYEVDADEVARMVDYSKQAMSQVSEPLGHGKCEEKVYEGNIRSRQDYVAVVASPQGPLSISSLDWKSGRVMIPKPGQMLANAAALRRRYGMPSSGYIYTGEVWLRDRELIERRYDARRLDAFEERLEDELKYAGRSYSPGGGCTFCRHSLTCQARREYLRASASMISETEIDKMTPMAIADLWPRKQILEAALAEYKKVAKTLLEAHGELELSDGSVLQYLDTKKQTIDAKKAWPVMTDYGLSAAEINGVISVQKGKLETIVGNKAKAKGGVKKSATAGLMDDLREAGAVTVKVGKQTRLKRKI